MKNLVTLFFLVFTLALTLSAQDAVIDISKVPMSSDQPRQFAPQGWKVEHDAMGDLNGDGKIDHAIALIEDKKVDGDDMPGPDRNRVLVVAFADGGKLKRVAVADKLLQCTSCGGSFYGVMDAPAHVSIVKGVIVVNQDHGSREVSESTFRFRYDAASGRFLLIGFDYDYRDRAIGETAKESTNYVTGVRVTTTGKRKRVSTKRTKIKADPIYLDSLDGDEFEYAAVERLGLG